MGSQPSSCLSTILVIGMFSVAVPLMPRHCHLQPAEQRNNGYGTQRTFPHSGAVRQYLPRTGMNLDQRKKAVDHSGNNPLAFLTNDPATCTQLTAAFASDSPSKSGVTQSSFIFTVIKTERNGVLRQSHSFPTAQADFLHHPRGQTVLIHIPYPLLALDCTSKSLRLFLKRGLPCARPGASCPGKRQNEKSGLEPCSLRLTAQLK